MLYKTACMIRSNAKAILRRIIRSGEVEGKGTVMFVKNMVCRGVPSAVRVLIIVQRKYEQIVGLMNEEGYVVGVDWIDHDTESMVQWEELNGEGKESSIELSTDEDNERGMSFSFL
jgi:hypothetical protein